MTGPVTADALGVGTLPVKITEDRRLLLIDQRKLPHAVEYVDATGLDAMAVAIKEMVVRGAPSIGVAAALGLAAHGLSLSRSDREAFSAGLASAQAALRSTRPTAVNLMWGLDRVMSECSRLLGLVPELPVEEVADRLFLFAEAIMQNHIEVNRKIGELGAGLIGQDQKVLTHCNAGSLAACGWGTALGVIRSAHLKGGRPSVFVDETRPRVQGARLTMWELEQDGIPATLVCDSMAGHLMSKKMVDLVVVGADRIALNGDTANKIGTYSLAVICHHHGVPFYIAAPVSTIDPELSTGDLIPIEHRAQTEVTEIDGLSLTTAGAKAFNPAFDVTPGSLITGIITEVGILRPDYRKSIAGALSAAEGT